MAELNDPATGGGAAAGGFCRCAIDNENVERGQSPQRLGPRSPLPTPVRCEGSGLNVASGGGIGGSRTVSRPIKLGNAGGGKALTSGVLSKKAR
jgi:hypothetical protein